MRAVQHGVHHKGHLRVQVIPPAYFLYSRIKVPGTPDLEGLEWFEDSQGGPQGKVGFVHKPLVPLKEGTPDSLPDPSGPQDAKLLGQDGFHPVECFCEHFEVLCHPFYA